MGAPIPMADAIVLVTPKSVPAISGATSDTRGMSPPVLAPSANIAIKSATITPDLKSPKKGIANRAIAGNIKAKNDENFSSFISAMLFVLNSKLTNALENFSYYGW